MRAGPEKTAYELCMTCSYEVRQASLLQPYDTLFADSVRLGRYAYKGEQMYRVTQGYKNAIDLIAGEYQTNISSHRSSIFPQEK